jgi:Pyruvate/2-oxoacid:ferredoxin oxidoreductase delta subunit
MTAAPLGAKVAANVRGPEIDLDYGEGCGPCAAECPCGAIEMEPEEI